MIDPSFAAAHDLFRGLLESGPDAVIIVDDRGRIQIVNGMTEVLFDYPRDDLIGREIEIWLPDRFRLATRSEKGAT